ncbi:peptidyl-prolyl cis-trans isomerase FKBP16-3, chloroplastic-like isoform X2 [Juglans regia]|uniref:peptidylprolyl isomerase n=1 Tax=Juglans regia TaxID=51240 RepID=A0A6P9EGW5_JUGRE|nr:peptidyl-prolyl cis-trans isomerase FKBP16-3, chloroplastic-like isoform X2 [Juglans regia]
MTRQDFVIRFRRLRAPRFTRRMASLLLPIGSAFGNSLFANHQAISSDKVRGLVVRCSTLDLKAEASRASELRDEFNVIKRRDIIGLAFGLSSLFIDSFEAKGAGLPPEQKPRLCDDTCEKELENVPMVTTESGLQYKDIKVGAGPSPPVGFQVVKGLDEGILSMKAGGKRRIFIPGSLAFPKGLTSAPGRPRVAPNSPVIFDVSLEYIPGLEVDEE